MKIEFVNWSGLTRSETIFYILAGNGGSGISVDCIETKTLEQPGDHALSDSLAEPGYCHDNEEGMAETDMVLACYDRKQTYSVSGR